MTRWEVCLLVTVEAASQEQAGLVAEDLIGAGLASLTMESNPLKQLGKEVDRMGDVFTVYVQPA